MMAQNSYKSKLLKKKIRQKICYASKESWAKMELEYGPGGYTGNYGRLPDLVGWFNKKGTFK